MNKMNNFKDDSKKDYAAARDAEWIRKTNRCISMFILFIVIVKIFLSLSTAV